MVPVSIFESYIEPIPLYINFVIFSQTFGGHQRNACIYFRMSVSSLQSIEQFCGNAVQPFSMDCL